MLAEGPKVFAFDALILEALENFNLNVATADYVGDKAARHPGATALGPGGRWGVP
jgi:hypothetical protein